MTHRYVLVVRAFASVVFVVVFTAAAARADCRKLDGDSVDLASAGSSLSPELLEKAIAWAEAHPDEAKKLGRALATRAEALQRELKEQLARLEVAHQARCTGALSAAEVVTVKQGAASLEGRLLLPSGLMPLASARVTLETVTGERVTEVQASACGRFRIDGLRVGAYRLRFATKRFGGSVEVTVEKGGVQRDFRVQSDAMRVAVFAGHYDAVEVLLAALGIRFDRLSLGCLTEEELARYDVVFVNCRPPGQTELGALQDFVARGGSVYFSDLTLPWVETLWPKRIKASPDRGTKGVQTARVDDAELKAALGKEQLELKFNLGGWRHAATPGAGQRVLLADAKSGVPLMLLFDEEKGRVGFTSFHYTAQPPDDTVLSLIFFLTRL